MNVGLLSSSWTQLEIMVSMATLAATHLCRGAVILLLCHTKATQWACVPSTVQLWPRRAMSALLECEHK